MKKAGLGKSEWMDFCIKHPPVTCFHLVTALHTADRGINNGAGV